MVLDWNCKLEATGSLVTTAYTMSLKFMLQNYCSCNPSAENTCTCPGEGKGLQFEGAAIGIFSPVYSQERDAEGQVNKETHLEDAKVFTNDLAALKAKGSIFFFSLSNTCFLVSFYDDEHNLMGELHANPLAIAGNPGSGNGFWSVSTASTCPASQVVV